MMKLVLLVLLSRLYIWADDVKGEYEIIVSFQSYANPTGRCLQCGGASPGQQGCCDISFPVPLTSRCLSPGMCDTALSYCLREVGATGLCPDSERRRAPRVEVDSSEFDFDSLFFGKENPVMFSGSESWQGSQLLLILHECAQPSGLQDICVVNISGLIIIDTIPMDITVAAGMSIPLTTYSGTANISHVTVNSIEVRCTDGFYGPDCSTACPNFVNCTSCGLAGFTGQFCENVDDCVGVVCGNGGKCVDELDGFRCECVTGFTGDHCESIDDCVGVECGNGGKCVDELDGFRCECVTGFTGDHCESIDDCVGVECNNGTCVDEILNSRCECDPGFTGDHCEINIGYCEGVDCNNGICVEESNDFRCNCLSGFTGDLCLGALKATSTTGTIVGIVVAALGVAVISIVCITVAVVAIRRRVKRFNETSMKMTQNQVYGISNSGQEAEKATQDEIKMTQNQVYGISVAGEEADIVTNVAYGISGEKPQKSSHQSLEDSTYEYIIV